MAINSSSSRNAITQQQLMQQLGKTQPSLSERLGNDPRAELIPCPAIKTLVREGLITPDANGRVDVAQLKQAFRTLGVTRPLTTVLGHGGAAAIEGEFNSKTLNVFKLFKSSLDHKGSMVHAPGEPFDQKLLDQLKSFSSDGVSLTIKDLAKAQDLRMKQEGASTKERVIGTVEAGLLIAVVGTVNTNGDKSVKLADLDSFMKDNLLPADWKPRSASLTDVVWTAAKDAFAMLTGTAGRADHGLRSALGADEPLNQSSMPGLVALCPTGGKPLAGKGISVQEVGTLHASLAQDAGL